MKYILFFSLMMAFAACRKECDCASGTVPPTHLVDTLPPNTLTALKNGVGITCELYGGGSEPLEDTQWYLSSSRKFNFTSPDIDVFFFHMPFAPGKYDVKKIIWPQYDYPGSRFAITKYGEIEQRYYPDTTKEHLVIVENVDTARSEITGRFEVVYAIELPKASPSFADTIAFKNGRFRVTINR
mgnify:CR=1 FL=1